MARNHQWFLDRSKGPFVPVRTAMKNDLVQILYRGSYRLRETYLTPGQVVMVKKDGTRVVSVWDPDEETEQYNDVPGEPGPARTSQAVSRRSPSRNRAEGMSASQRLMRIHDELYGAFTALQITEAELKKIPEEDLRTPIVGFRDKRWLLTKIFTLRADLDTLSKALRARAFPVR